MEEMEHQLTAWQSTKDVEEYFERLAEKKLDMKRQESAYAKAFSNAQTDCHPCMSQILQENEALSEFKREKQRILDTYERRAEAERISKLKEVEKSEMEKAKLHKSKQKALGDGLLEQIREKMEMAEMNKQQGKNVANREKPPLQQCAKEMKDTERNAETKNALFKQQFEEISEDQLQKEQEMKEKAAHECTNSIRSFPDLVKMSLRHTEIVSQNLAAILEKQAAIAALREEKMESGVRSFNATKEKQLEEEKEKRGANTKSISENRPVQMKENVEKKKPEDWTHPLSKSIDMQSKDHEKRWEIVPKYAKENLRMPAEKACAKQKQTAAQKETSGSSLHDMEDKFSSSCTNEDLLKLPHPTATHKDESGAVTPQDSLEWEFRCTKVTRPGRARRHQRAVREKRLLPPSTPIFQREDSGVVTNQQYMKYRSTAEDEVLHVHCTSHTR